jgi:hypothetical protein
MSINVIDVQKKIIEFIHYTNIYNKITISFDYDDFIKQNRIIFTQSRIYIFNCDFKQNFNSYDNMNENIESINIIIEKIKDNDNGSKILVLYSYTIIKSICNERYYEKKEEYDIITLTEELNEILCL